MSFVQRVASWAGCAEGRVECRSGPFLHRRSRNGPIEAISRPSAAGGVERGGRCYGGEVPPLPPVWVVVVVVVAVEVVTVVVGGGAVVVVGAGVVVLVGAGATVAVVVVPPPLSDAITASATTSPITTAMRSARAHLTPRDIPPGDGGAPPGRGGSGVPM